MSDEDRLTQIFYDRFVRGSNPVEYFVEKALESDAGKKAPKIDMIYHYEKFCQYYSLTPESPQSLSRKLTQCGMRSKFVRINGEPTWVWLDVILVDWEAAKKAAAAKLEDYTPKMKQRMR
jgi:hypothetical protein